MTELRAERLCVTLNGTPLLKPATFKLSPGELVIVLGPNGAGKTSLLRACLGLGPPASGEARLDGVNIRTLNPMARARQVAYLPQVRPLAWPSRVRDVVALGRYSHGAAVGRLSTADAAAVDEALEACDLADLANRPTDTLSGGELARVHCARAFAARAPLLIADEPVAALDPRHQFRIMDLVAGFVADGGGALVVLHDLNVAARYASRLIWMAGGEIVADGSVEQTLTPNRLATVYGLEATVSAGQVQLKGAL